VGSSTPNAVTGLPYSLVEVDEQKKPLRQRVREADSLQWKLWLQKYAWLLSLITMAPGFGLAAFVATGNVVLAVGTTSAAVLTAGGVFWWRTRRLP
jgi:hypothetical protein